MRRNGSASSRFLHALSYCMLLPGPEAQQLAIYIGWLMHRWPGAIVAGGLFVVPGIISIMALSYIYAAFGNVPAVAALFFGLKAAVLAIVLAGGAPGRQPRAQKPGDACARGRRLYRHLLFRRAVPADRAGGGGYRLCRRAQRLDAHSGSASTAPQPRGRHRRGPARRRNCPSTRGRRWRAPCAFRRSGSRCGWCR